MAVHHIYPLPKKVSHSLKHQMGGKYLGSPLQNILRLLRLLNKNKLVMHIYDYILFSNATVIQTKLVKLV